MLKRTSVLLLITLSLERTVLELTRSLSRDILQSFRLIARCTLDEVVWYDLFTQSTPDNVFCQFCNILKDTYTGQRRVKGYTCFVTFYLYIQNLTESSLDAKNVMLKTRVA